MTLPRRVVAAIVLGVLVGGCATGPSKVDPWEPMNRQLYAVHDALDTAVAKPVAEGYEAIIPKFIRTGISNAFHNLDDLFSAINGILSGRFDSAGNDLGRVMINTLAGAGGLIDVASDAGIERGNLDFGTTFAIWGLPAGP